MPEKNKGGRPKLNLDENQLFELARIHCTYAEIAAVMKCSVDTLYERYSDTIKRGKEDGKASLRRMQWKKAEQGSNALLIWLGKQLLGQKDKAEIDQNIRTQIEAKLEGMSHEELVKTAIGAMEGFRPKIAS